jgi:hypothetical protein
MVEPNEPIKDRDGFTWVPGENGWNLLHHENMLCYVNQPFAKVEVEYGPLRELTVYERIYFNKSKNMQI